MTTVFWLLYLAFGAAVEFGQLFDGVLGGTLSEAVWHAGPLGRGLAAAASFAAGLHFLLNGKF